MQLDRRSFLGLMAAGLGAVPAGPARANASPAKHKIKALAFDAFPIFDPRPLANLAERLFPGRGQEVTNTWRTRQFEYQWLRTLGDQYADFWQATNEALIFTARALKLEMNARTRELLMNGYAELKAWPEAATGLKALKAAGFRLAFLSNMTTPMLEGGIAASGLEGLFDHVLGTDRVKAHKPHPRAYQMALDAFGLTREEILFAAFAGWDVAGAKWFGFPTYWINRAGAPPEELGVQADASGPDILSLAGYLEVRS